MFCISSIAREGTFGRDGGEYWRGFDKFGWFAELHSWEFIEEIMGGGV